MPPFSTQPYGPRLHRAAPDGLSASKPRVLGAHFHSRSLVAARAAVPKDLDAIADAVPARQGEAPCGQQTSTVRRGACVSEPKR